MMRLSLQTLSSIFIMNIPKTDLAVLSKFIENAPGDGALPCNLSDDVLLQIARDLRVVEIASTTDESVDPPMGGPMYLFLHLMQTHAGKLTGHSECKLELANVDDWLQTYMHYIEREIVSRAVKMPCQPDTDDLIAFINKEVLAVN